MTSQAFLLRKASRLAKLLSMAFAGIAKKLLETEVNQTSGGTGLELSTDYVYDDTGRRTRTTLPGGSYREAYFDVGGRLTKTSGGPEGTVSCRTDGLPKASGSTTCCSNVRQ
jgi:hypothetical protein